MDNSGFDPDTIDIGIVQGEPPWPGMRADRLMAEELAPVAAPGLIDGGDRVDDPHALLEHTLLQHTTRPDSWKIWFETQGCEPPQTFSGPFFSQFQIIIEAAVAGHGVAMLPLILVAQELGDGRLVTPHSHVARTSSGYYLLTPSKKVGIRRIEAFREWFLDAVARDYPGET